MKRFLAILLSMTLLLSCIGTISFADEGDGGSTTLGNDVRKTYINVSLEGYESGNEIFFGFSTEEGDKGILNVYGVTEAWGGTELTYANAPANDKYSNSVDLTKVYGQAPLATYSVSGAANYAVDLKAFATSVLAENASAKSLTLAFVVEAETTGVGNVTIVPRENTETNFIQRQDFTNWTKGASYTGTTKITTQSTRDTTSEQRNVAPNLGSPAPAGEIVDTVGLGNSFKLTPSVKDSGVKFYGTIRSLTVADLGKTMTISFKTRVNALPEGKLEANFTYGLTSSERRTKNMKEGVEADTVNYKENYYGTSYTGIVTEDMLGRWITWSMDVTIDEMMLPKIIMTNSGTVESPIGIGMITICSDGLETADIYIDDLVTTETIEIETNSAIYSQNFDDVTTKGNVMLTKNLTKYWAVETAGGAASNSYHQSNDVDAQVTYNKSTKSFKVNTYQSDYRLLFYLFDHTGSIPTNLFEVGKTYEISFWMNSNRTGTFHVGLNKNSAETNVGGAITNAKETSVYQTNTWVKYTYEFTADSTTATMNAIEMRPTGFEGLLPNETLAAATEDNPITLATITPVTFYIDDLECKEISPAIYSQNFDDVTTKGNVMLTKNLTKYWAVETAGDAASNSYHQSNDVDAQVTYNKSTKSFKVNTYQSDYRLLFYLFDHTGSIPTNLFEVGKTYEISFWMNSNRTGTFHVGLNKNSVETNVDGAITNAKETSVSQTNTWVKYTYEFTADSTTATMNAIEMRPTEFEGLLPNETLATATEDNPIDLTDINQITFYVDDIICREVAGDAEELAQNTPLAQATVAANGATATDTLIASSAIGGLVGNDLVLNGDIAVNYYMWIDDKYENSATSYLECTLPNEEVERVAFKDLSSESVTVDSASVSCKKFTANVAAKEMADESTVTLFVGADAPGSSTYTMKVQDYAKAILDSEGNTEYDNAKNLVKAMLNYGAYAQTYFKHNTDNLANASYEWESSELGDVTTSILETYKSNLKKGDANVKLAGTSLVLESNTTLQFYFTVDSDVKDLKFTYGDRELTAKTSGGYTCVEITDIAANNLDENYTIDISYEGSTTTPTASYNCMAYAYDVLRQSSDYTEDLQNLVKAMYLYNRAANAYNPN